MQKRLWPQTARAGASSGKRGAVDKDRGRGHDGRTKGRAMGMQAALRAVFPPQCISCGAQTADDFALCGTCWRQTPFIGGLVCDCCGVPLSGTDEGRAEYCDDCLSATRPWDRGRAALLYRDKGREMVLALKHGDRLDLVRPAARWMAQAAVPILQDGMVVVPVPLHRWRLLHRRYNQSALLSAALARLVGAAHCPDALIRPRSTESQDGRGHDTRFANLAGAIRAHPGRIHWLKGRPVLLVDDVMTSGATLSACAEACLAAGSGPVSTLVLARVAKDA
jgi:predicted amidophosphoribosyltransferase